MKKRTIMLSFAALLLATACDTALTVGSRTIGIRSGEFLFTDGYLRGTYNFDLDRVWTACDKTLADLKATEVTRARKIAAGTFTALIQGDKVRINVDYIQKGMTSVSVMVGTAGNNLASQLIHERIAGFLKASP